MYHSTLGWRVIEKIKDLDDGVALLGAQELEVVCKARTVRQQVNIKCNFRTFWKVLRTHHDFVMKQGRLKSLRPRREIVN